MRERNDHVVYAFTMLSVNSASDQEVCLLVFISYDNQGYSKMHQIACLMLLPTFVLIIGFVCT